MSSMREAAKELDIDYLVALLNNSNFSIIWLFFTKNILAVYGNKHNDNS